MFEDILKNFRVFIHKYANTTENMKVELNDSTIADVVFDFGCKSRDDLSEILLGGVRFVLIDADRNILLNDKNGDCLLIFDNDFERDKSNRLCLASKRMIKFVKKVNDTYVGLNELYVKDNEVYYTVDYEYVSGAKEIVFCSESVAHIMLLRNGLIFKNRCDAEKMASALLRYEK
ncbi:hypothetical protein ACFFHT_00360 [Gallibacterium melopsittaci]|uniref:Uncharacterized protein n=1 Tax=Gallibacterium melopsittaci TaxID=516063 RepID=A0ABV6HTN4_9PAST